MISMKNLIFPDKKIKLDKRKNFMSRPEAQLNFNCIKLIFISFI